MVGVPQEPELRLLQLRIDRVQAFPPSDCPCLIGPSAMLLWPGPHSREAGPKTSRNEKQHPKDSFADPFATSWQLEGDFRKKQQFPIVLFKCRCLDRSQHQTDAREMQPNCTSVSNKGVVRRRCMKRRTSEWVSDRYFISESLCLLSNFCHSCFLREAALVWI